MGRPGSSAAGSGGRRRRHHPAGEFGRMPRSRLTGTPASAGRRSRSVAGWGRAFGACCFAGKLRSLVIRPGRPLGGRLDPYVIPYVNLYVIPYAQGWRTPGLGGRAHLSSSVPLGGVERPRRAVRFARLTHRRVRVLGGPAVRAACGGNLACPALLRRVVRHGPSMPIYLRRNGAPATASRHMVT
jgi:hypothetical protein